MARTHGIKELLGATASPALLSQSNRLEEGWFQGVTIEGIAVYTAFSRSRISNWTVAIGAPVEGVARPMRRSLIASAPIAAKRAVKLRRHAVLRPDTVTLDPLRFKQIVYNLVSNAVKFSDSDQEVLVTLDTAGEGRFRLKVIDSGSGIKPEELHLLFQNFQQVQSGLARRHEGTGLGLVLTKKIVDMHNGSISVESKYGEGTTFTVVLPLDSTSPDTDPVES